MKTEVISFRRVLGKCILALALVMPSLSHAATPLVTQYIAPVTAPTWNNAVTNATYGTGEGFKFTVAHQEYGGKTYCNFFMPILNQGYDHPYFLAWSNWISFTYWNGSSNQLWDFWNYGVTTWVRSVISPEGAPSARYFYHAKFDSKGSWDIATAQKSVVSTAGESPALNWDQRFTKCGQDASSEGASFVQCVHTDWVYKVTFDANGGSGVMAPITFTNSVALPSYGFTRNGYAFTGWNTQSDGDGDRYSDEATIYGDLNLHAQWKVGEYVVTLDNQGATSLGTKSVKATFDKTLPDIIVPARTGYTFGGYFTGKNGSGAQWYKANGESSETAWNIDSDTTLYAYWSGIRYHVSFAKTDDDVVGEMERQEFVYGQEQALHQNAFTRTGYSFIGWSTSQAASVAYVDCEVVSNLTTNADEDYVLYARWAASSYDVALDNQEGSGDDSVQVTYGVSLPDVTPPTRDGYRFGGYWTEEDGGGEQYYDRDGHGVKPWNIANNATLYAKWSVVTHSVVFLATDGVFADGEETKVVDDVLQPGLPYGVGMPMPVAPEDVAIFFSGWWTSTNPVDRVQVLATDSVDVNVTNLYARWKAVVVPETCMLTFKAKLQGGSTTTWTTNAVAGAEFGGYFPSPAPTDGEYEVFGWYIGDTRVNDTDVVAGDATLTANWTLAAFNDAWGCRDIRFETKGENGAEGWSLDAKTVVARSGRLPDELGQWDGVKSCLVMTPERSGNLSLELKSSCTSEILDGDRLAALTLYVFNNIALLSGISDDYEATPVTHVDAGKAVTLEYYQLGSFARDYASPGTEECGWARNLVWEPDAVESALPDWCALEGTSLTAEVGGGSEWTVSQDDAEEVAVSNMQDSRTAWLSVHVSKPSAGELRFKWRVSGEGGYVDTNGVYQVCDRLEFSDERGGEVLRVEGLMDGFAEVVWTNEVESAHVFTWRYIKDGDTKEGEDGAWLRDVVWTPFGGEPEEPTETVVEYDYEEDGEVKHGSVAVPNTWVDEYRLIETTGASDYLAALKMPSGKIGYGGAPLCYWADYIAGTVPTNPASVFRVTGFSVVDGAIVITWDPDRDDREYTVWGKTNLTDAAWHTPTNSASRFFRVEVDLPSKR